MRIAFPVLKWAGGKRKLLNEILALMPVDYKARRFHEPFFGGGAVTFWIEPISGTINDINPKLINFYIVLRDHLEELIADLRTHESTKEYYYEAREEFNRIIRQGFSLPHLRLASLFMYLNRMSYNGLYRENSKGEFNVPYGKYDKFRIDEESLRRASAVLKRLDIYNEDFSYVLRVAEEGDVVYLDPPYYPVSDTANFTRYSSYGFRLEDHRRLRDLCLELHRRGVYFVLSNSYSKTVRSLYEGLRGIHIFMVYANRAINSKGERRGKVPELLITNVPEELRVSSLEVNEVKLDVSV